MTNMETKQQCKKTEIRIGKFAEINGISIDTIRYYIQRNLIHPIRKGKYFYFGNEQQEQLDSIVYFKELRFSLDEIKMLMCIEKLSTLETPAKRDHIENMFIAKLDKLQQEKAQLEDIISKLSLEIEAVKQTTNANVESRGIPFCLLNILYCPRCQRKLTIHDGILMNHSVYAGKVICECGYAMTIEEGIILNLGESDKKGHAEQSECLITNLFNNTSHTFVEQMLYSTEETTRCIAHYDLHSKTVLLMKTGAGTLAMSLLNKCSGIGTLILFDEDVEQLKIAKKTISKHFPEQNVIYIGGSFKILPIQNESVDLAIDFAASFEAALEKSLNLYKYLMLYMRSKSIIIGFYLSFKKSIAIEKIGSNPRKLLDSTFVPNYLKKNGYRISESYEGQKLKISDGLGGFCQTGDLMNTRIVAYNKN